MRKKEKKTMKHSKGTALISGASRDIGAVNVIVLEPGLVIFKIYNGYWFFGRPGIEEPRGVRVSAVAPGLIYTRPEARDLFDSLGAAI